VFAGVEAAGAAAGLEELVEDPPCFTLIKILALTLLILKTSPIVAARPKFCSAIAVSIRAFGEIWNVRP
jgi:hypothetical protein